MRRKILNPYDPELNKCFGCSKKNPIGLHLDFEEADDAVIAVWEPGEFYQGYLNVLHGGIIASLLDEVGAWCVSVKTGTAGVTTQLKVNYLKPVFINRGNITLSAYLEKKEGSKAYIKSTLTDGIGKICAEAESVFFTYPPEVAKRKFGFPGKEYFFEQ